MSDIATINGFALDSYIPAQWAAEHDEAVSTAAAIVECSDDYQARKVAASVKALRDLKKIVHSARMDVTRRIDAVKKAIIAREDAICKRLTEEDERLSALGGAYATAKAEAEAAARAQAEQENLAEAMLGGETTEVDTAKGPLITGARTRTMVVFRVVDPDAVPRAYCTPDDKLIRAYVQAVKNANPNWEVSSFSIPGVAFEREVRV